MAITSTTSRHDPIRPRPHERLTRPVRVAVAFGLATTALACSLACDRHPTPTPTTALPPRPTAAARTARPAAQPPSPPTRQVSGLRYVTRLTGGAQPDQRLPMIVAIHGLGDRPGQFGYLFRGFDLPARVILPEAIHEHYKGFSWFPIQVWDPDADRVTAGLRRATAALARALEELPARYPTRGKPIVTGFSQGGMLALSLAVYHGQRMAASYPVAGWLPRPLWPTERPTDPPPIVAIHGERDDVLKLERTQRGVSALQQLGYSIELHVHPDVEHAISDEMRQQLWSLLRTGIRQLPADPAAAVGAPASATTSTTAPGTP